jgi:hypothetical protein
MLSFIAELKENTPGGGFAGVDSITIAAPEVERGPGVCAKGQTGVLCASCEKGWFRRGSLDLCQKCAEDTEQAMWLAVGLSLGGLVVLVTVIGLDLHFGWTRQRGGGRLKPVVNAVQQMTVMMLFPVKWPPLMMKLSSVFEGFSFDVSLVSPTCLGIPFNFYNRFMWSSSLAFVFSLAPFVGGAIYSLLRALFPRLCGCRSKSNAVDDDRAAEVDEAEQREENLEAKLATFYKQHITLDAAHRQEQLDKIPSLVSKYEGDYPKMWRILTKTYIDDKSTFRSRLHAAWRTVLPIAIIYSLTVILFVHPAVSGLAFFFFRCHEIKDMAGAEEASDGVGNAAAAAAASSSSRSYLVADYSIECYDGAWNAMYPYAMFVVVVFSFGLPLVLLVFLFIYQKDIIMIAQIDTVEQILKKIASFKASFDVYDIDGDNTISPTELRAAMIDHDMKLSDADSVALFNRVDVDDDGGISRKEFQYIADMFKVDVPEGTAAAMEKGGETILKKFVGRFGFAGALSTLGVAKGIELTKKVGSGIQHFRSHHSSTSGAGGTEDTSGEETKAVDAKSDSTDTNAPTNASSPNDGGGESKHDAEDASSSATTVEMPKTRLGADRLAILYSIYTPRCFFFDIINFYHKLFLWATLVFFRRGSLLQMGSAVLLTAIRLVLHAHFEPYKDPVDNLFDYLTLTISFLTGLGGVLLQGLDTEKEFSFSKSDDVGVETAKVAIAGVNMFLEVIVYVVVAVFSMFLAYAMVGRNAKVQHVISILTRLCISPDATAAEAVEVIGRQDENRGTTRNRRLDRGGDVGDGSAVITRCVVVNNAPSTELGMIRNPSFRRSSPAREDTELEGGRRAASNSAGGVSPSVAVVVLPGESKGDDVTVDDRFENSSVGVSKLGSAPDLVEKRTNAGGGCGETKGVPAVRVIETVM